MPVLALEAPRFVGVDVVLVEPMTLVNEGPRKKYQDNMRQCRRMLADSDMLRSGDKMERPFSAKTDDGIQ